MKAIVTKYGAIKFSIFLSVLFIVTSCEAKTYNSIDEIISNTSNSKNKPSSPPTTPPAKVHKEIAIPKDNKGNFQVSWRILQEYDVNNEKIGTNLKKIINKSIIIKGFMIPLDYSEKNIKEFLLVPYMPSCAHVPPPPPNMIINVKVQNKSGVKPSYYPVEITGKIKIAKSEKSNPYMPDGVYSLDASSIKEAKQ